jgi:PKD repeat protein
MSKNTKKRNLLAVIFAIYFTFILLSTIPYLAEQDLFGSRSEEESYESHLVFPRDGEFGHYKKVILTDNSSAGKIDLKYTFDTNTLYIQKVENIKELVIDCNLMYINKYKEVFGNEPSTLEDAEIYNNNGGLLTVIINTNTPMDKLEIIGTPMPKKVMVNKAEWWETETSYYFANENNITISYIPIGSTTVEIYFKDIVEIHPNAHFTASDYIALQNETIIFDASPSSDEDGNIVDYIWDLGDSTKSISEIVEHSYSKVGNYSVKLIVRDNDDLVDYYSENITIVESNKSFQKVVVDEVEIDIRSAAPQNLSIEIAEEPPEIPETVAEDFNLFLNITSDETVNRFQLKIYLGPIGGAIIPKGTNPESIKLFYYDEEEKSWVEIEDSYYDPKTGILTAKLDHLTVFAPMSNEGSAEKGKSEEDGAGNIGIYVLIIVIVIVIFGILGVVIKKKKKKGKDKGKGKSHRPKTTEGDESKEKDKEEVGGKSFDTEKLLESPSTTDKESKVSKPHKPSKRTRAKADKKSDKKTSQSSLPIKGPPKKK